MEPVTLIIEKAGQKMWGRVLFEDNLIVDVASTPEGLQKSMKRLIHEFHGLDPDAITFAIQYETYPKRIFQRRSRVSNRLAK